MMLSITRYAGYRQEDGSILGDPSNAALTEAMMEQGWRPPSPQGRSGFDVLPIVIKVPGSPPMFFDIPPELVQEVFYSLFRV